MKIKTIAIVGMGALGMMYGEQIQQSSAGAEVIFIMDTARYVRHKNDTYTVNGIKQNFILTDCRYKKTADLVIFATKYPELQSALDVSENSIGDDTVIISLLNGISSEKIIAERYGDKNLVYCVAIGMDSVRVGTSLKYTNRGHLQIGIIGEKQRPALNKLKNFFDASVIFYSEKQDIIVAMWAKFLLNVGINQACTVFETTYSGIFENKKHFDSMSRAMDEVIRIAQKEGINLTEADRENAIRIIRSLDPGSIPSMRQDSVARRKTEVDLFAGTVIDIAKKHSISVPENELYYKRILELESKY